MICFLFFVLLGGRGEKVDGTTEKIEVKREQFEKIIHGKIMYVHKNRPDNYKRKNVNKETINN